MTSYDSRPLLGGALPQAVIFDMDGLMVDSEPVWYEAWHQAFARFGYEEQPGLVASFTGHTRDHICEMLVSAYDGDETVHAVFDEHYRLACQTFLAEGAPIKPGLPELLALLAEKDVPCAVASSSQRAVVEAVLGHAGIGKRFSVVLTGDDGLPSKPAPDIFLAAARHLGADPARTLVLEDSPAGIRAAATGGFVPVMVPDLVAPTEAERALGARVCPSLLTVRDLLTEVAPGA